MYQSRTPDLRQLFIQWLVSLMLIPVFSFGAVEIEPVAFGFNSGYKTGKWAPVDITVRSENEPFVGELVIEVRNFFSDAPIQRYATPLKLGATERQSRRLYVYCPKIATKLAIQVMPEIALAPRATTEMSPPTPIALKDYFVLALVPNGDKLKQFLDKKQIGEEAKAHVRYLPNARALPTQWIGYDAVNILVIREVALTERTVTKAQQTALLDWVQRGGTLVVSGGSNFRYLQGSFIETFLPVQLIGVETVDTFQVKTHRERADASIGRHERIIFKPKDNCQVVLGTNENIAIAKGNFGEGQILCLAFDYATLFNQKRPFTGAQVPVPRNLSLKETGETFWRELLETHGKSPRHLAERYAPHRRHEAKIYAQFLKKMPTQVPLIKLLAIALPVYLFSFGAVLFILKRRGRSYWIGGVLLVLVSLGAIGAARTVLPNSVTAERLGIVTVYPERQRAHLQRYVALRATAHEETSIAMPQSTFIRPLESGERRADSGLGTMLQGATFQLRRPVVAPWHPRTYVEEVFFSWDKTWQFEGELVTVDSTLKRVPPDEELDNTRKVFAQILQREGVLQYLLNVENAMQLGWTSQPLIDTADVRQVTDETLVMLYLDKADNIAQ